MLAFVQVARQALRTPWSFHRMRLMTAATLLMAFTRVQARSRVVAALTTWHTVRVGFVAMLAASVSTLHEFYRRCLGSMTLCTGRESRRGLVRAMAPFARVTFRE